MTTIVSEQIKSNLRKPDEPTRVGIQGYPGAFHEMAARYYFKDQNMEVVPAHTFEDMVRNLVAGETMDVALMAIENTLAGSIKYNYNLLLEHPVSIVGEVYLRIKQNLLVLPGTQLEDLREVHSHHMAIAQCRRFFRQYPHIHLVETVDTALSAKDVRDNHWKHIGAIASDLAAEMYGLEILEPSIETNKMNYTRFLVLRPNSKAGAIERSNKVSLCFATEHNVGSLHQVLGILAAYNANLTKIQSAPIMGKEWEYMFYVDFMSEGALSWQQAIDAITPLTSDLHVLGVYQRGEKFDM